MHGIIHAGLKKYFGSTSGHESWAAILKEAGLGSTEYLPTQSYPDADATAIVAAASKLTGVPVDSILEDFGEFLASDLLSMYRSLIKPEWKTMEVLLNAEETLHRVVRAHNPGVTPPRLRFEKTGPRQLKLYYDSRRRLSALAKGITKGIARHYGQMAKISEIKNADGSSELTITIK